MTSMFDTDGGPVAVIEMPLLVEFFRFTLQCVPSGGDGPLAFEEPDGRLVAGLGGALLRSAGSDHEADVRVESWPTAPPPEPIDYWDEIETGRLISDGAYLELASVTAAASDERIPLIAGEYWIRAHVRQTAPFPDELEPEMSQGRERWLLQVWPV